PSGERATRDALALAEWALPREQAYDWQQALMDLGARICIGRRPLCERCPLAAYCAAYTETAQATLFPSGEALVRLRDARAMAQSVEGTRGTLMVAEQQTAYTTGAEESHANGRRSARRGAQEPFERSSRYYRGRIVTALRALAPGESLPLASLGPCVKDDYTPEDTDWLSGLVQALARDGLVQLTVGDDGQESAAL